EDFQEFARKVLAGMQEQNTETASLINQAQERLSHKLEKSHSQVEELRRMVKEVLEDFAAGITEIKSGISRGFEEIRAYLEKNQISLDNALQSHQKSMANSINNLEVKNKSMQKQQLIFFLELLGSIRMVGMLIVYITSS